MSTHEKFQGINGRIRTALSIAVILCKNLTDVHNQSLVLNLLRSKMSPCTFLYSLENFIAKGDNKHAKYL